MAQKYRVIWRTDIKVVESVVPDQSTTITEYPDVDREYCVIEVLEDLSAILVSQGYDVTVIDDYIANNS